MPAVRPLPPFSRLLLLVLILGASSCGVGRHSDRAELTRIRQERGRIAPESEWNADGIWLRIATGPAEYIPRGYGRDSLRGPAQGHWVDDQRDGKRFFVPDQGAAGRDADILRRDALKHSTPERARPTRVAW